MTFPVLIRLLLSPMMHAAVYSSVACSTILVLFPVRPSAARSILCLARYSSQSPETLLSPIAHLLLEGSDDLFKFAPYLVVDFPDRGDVFSHVLMVLRDVMEQIGLKGPDLVHGHIVQESVDSGINRQHLVGNRHRFILPLLEQ